MTKAAESRSLSFGLGCSEVTVAPTLDKTSLFAVSDEEVMACHCLFKTFAWDVGWGQTEKQWLCPLHLSASSCSTTAIEARLMDLMLDFSRDSLLENPGLLNTIGRGVFTPRAVIHSGPGFTHAVAEEVSQGLTFLKCKYYQYNSFLPSVAWHINLSVQISLVFLLSYSILYVILLYATHQENFGLGAMFYTTKSSVRHHLCTSNG